MLTRIEIDGFKTFRNFAADFRPFTAIVGPNASGKSNLFDALRFLSLVSKKDVRQAMQELRGEPEELFRLTPGRQYKRMTFAVEVLLPKRGIDDFGTRYEITSQRIRYELEIAIRSDASGFPIGVFVDRESCEIIAGKDDQAIFAVGERINRSHRKRPFIETVLDDAGNAKAFLVRQDGIAESGTTKRGNPQQLSALEASRTALSTVSTAEFRHLYALKKLLTGVHFLEINPQAARKPSDRFEEKSLKQDASNLAAVLAEIERSSSTKEYPHGAISEISADLASLIPAVRSIKVKSDESSKEYAFEIELVEGLSFSSRVISDGTLRLLALLSIIDNPSRAGILCFEEPENGVHEGRIPFLIDILRSASEYPEEDGDYFQILMNTHSPAVMKALKDEEVLVADVVVASESKDVPPESYTRMRRYPEKMELFDESTHLHPAKVAEVLQRNVGGV